MDKEKLVELAVQTFCAVPEVYQAILKKQGYDLTDDTVEKIKSDSSFGEKLLNDEQTLAPIVQAFVENQDTIMEAMQGTLFRKGGKLDYLYSKFQKGGPLNIVLKRPNERDSVMYIKNVIGPQNAIESTIQRTYDKDGNPVTIEQETRRPITNEHWNTIVNEYNRRNQEIPSMFKPSNMNRYIVPNELQMGGPINRPFGNRYYQDGGFFTKLGQGLRESRDAKIGAVGAEQIRNLQNENPKLAKELNKEYFTANAMGSIGATMASPGMGYTVAQNIPTIVALSDVPLYAGTSALSSFLRQKDLSCPY